MSPEFSPDCLHPRVEAELHFAGLSFAECRYPADCSMPSHAHPEAYFVFSLQGTIKAVLRKQTFLRKPSTLIFLPAGEPHSNFFPQEGKTFNIALESEWLERLQSASTLL